VINDFEAALSNAEAFDQVLTEVPPSLSQFDGYAGLLSLSARQIFGALEITVSKADDGSWNQSDVKIFFKDMGNVGSGGTNAVDVLYAGFPAFLYLNPTLGRYLLEPLLESQVSNGVPVGQAYAPQDLGHNFPNVSSNTLPHNFGIERKYAPA